MKMRTNLTKVKMSVNLLTIIYEDNEFDESSDEEVGLNVVFKCRLETENSSYTGYLSRTSFPSRVKMANDFE